MLHVCSALIPYSTNLSHYTLIPKHVKMCIFGLRIRYNMDCLSGIHLWEVFHLWLLQHMFRYDWGANISYHIISYNAKCTNVTIVTF